MLIEHYKNFDEMYYKLNRKFLLHPEIIDVQMSDSGYAENVVIECDSWDCNLDLANFGYKVTKWGHLLNTYIDYTELLEFYDKLRKVKGIAFTFYFKRKKVNNGSCLISIVLKRNKRGGMWNEANVFYRVTETQRRMAADLVLINRFMNELPKDICDVKKVTFMMAQAYCSSKFINGFFDYFDIPREKLDYSNNWLNGLRKDYERYFQPDSEIHSFQTLARMQKLALGITKYKPIDINTLSIKEHFENKK